MSSLWSRVLTVVLNRGFLSGEAKVESPSGATRSFDLGYRPVTLFEAVRLGLGVAERDVDVADVSFWNWRILREQWRKVWQVLDAQVSELAGSKIQAVVWAFPKIRTESEIIQLLSLAEKSEIQIETQQPHRRPEARKMVAIGRTNAAIANTLGVIRMNLGVEYCDFLPELIETESNDEDFLGLLDDLVVNRDMNLELQDTLTLIPRQLVRSRERFVKMDGSSLLSFQSFLAALYRENKLSGNSDLSFSKRLLRLAPEDSKEVNRILEKIYAE